MKLVKQMKKKIIEDAFTDQQYELVDAGLSEARQAMERGDHEYLLEALHALITVCRNSKKDYIERQQQKTVNPLDSLLS